jgi:hypothetical protein
MNEKESKIISMITEAATNEDIIVDVIKNRKTGKLITVVTDYYNNNRMRSIEHPRKETTITDEKIINLNAAKNRLYKRKLENAEDEYAKKINKPAGLWSDEDLIEFNNQLAVKLKSSEEQMVFNQWKDEHYERIRVSNIDNTTQ